jgi:hypothetical protein
VDNPQEGFVFLPTLWYNEIMQITKQYIAGLIDGEGYLGILPSRAKGLKHTSYEPVIKIGMTGAEALYIFEVLIIKYRGNINHAKLSKGNRRVYVYVLKSKKNVLNLLKDIQPYLIVKREQAKILKDFCNLPYNHPNHLTFNIDIITIRDKMYNDLKLLKQPPATTN